MLAYADKCKTLYSIWVINISRECRQLQNCIPLKRVDFCGEKILMEEIILEHNGVKYSKEDLIELIDKVFEILGEDI